jgi:hypothetical protein
MHCVYEFHSDVRGSFHRVFRRELLTRASLPMNPGKQGDPELRQQGYSFP